MLRFLEFFAANTRDPHTRRVYGRAVAEFMTWCEQPGAFDPGRSTASRRRLGRAAGVPAYSANRQVALRHWFDSLVTGQVMPTNPAGSVRVPSQVVKQGKTPVLAPEEARALFDKIEIRTPMGLRDRVLIELMVFNLADRRAAGLRGFVA